MVYDISSLPPEVLIHIFDFLNVYQRLEASLVCSTWLHALNCHRFLFDIQIRLSKEIEEPIKLFSRMTRRFECFIFQRVIINDSVEELLQKYSSQFVSLAFLDCEVRFLKRESEFPDKLLHCDNLKILDVQNTAILFLFAPLPNVTVLKLCMCMNVSDSVISRFIELFFKLEELSVKVNDMCSMKYSVDDRTDEGNPQSWGLSFASIIMLIRKHKTTLRCIDLSRSCFGNAEMALLLMSKIKGLKLSSVAFPQGLFSNDMKQFCKNQLSLTSLDLSFSYYDMNNKVRDACKCLPNLQELVIRNSSIDNCIIEIFQLKHLEKLDLYKTIDISQNSYREAVSNLKTFKLKHLNLFRSKISDESLFQLLKQNQNMRFLHLTETDISNKTLNMICNNLTLLDHLILDSCRNISDSGLTGKCEDYSDSLSPTPLSNLKYLTELNLRYIPFITNEGCIEAIRFLNLKRLFLFHCPKLILNGDFEKELQKQNPSLRYLFCKQPRRRIFKQSRSKIARYELRSGNF